MCDIFGIRIVEKYFLVFFNNSNGFLKELQQSKFE